MRKIKKIAYIVLTCLIFTNIEVLASSESKINSNNSKINELNDKRSEIQAEKDSINSELLDLIKKMNAKQAEIDVVQEKIDILQIDIDALEKSILETEEEIKITEEKIKITEETYKQKEIEQEYQEEVLSERLKRNYINNTYNEFLAIVLDSSSLSEIIFKVKYVNDIMNNDKDIIEQLKETKIELAQVKAGLDEDKKSLGEKKSSLEYQKKSIKEKQDIVIAERVELDKGMAELSAIENEKQSKIDKLTASQNYLQGQIIDLTTENKALEAAMREASTGGVQNGDYSFITPTTGRYTSPYGYRIHPISGEYKMHTGIDIANSTGTPIVAASSGTVVRASYYGGYGQCIIINHGNGFSTLYAHLNSYNVSVGDTVYQGQTIGGMGSTGNSTGPHLHYEVWKNGGHVNPSAYLN